MTPAPAPPGPFAKFFALVLGAVLLVLGLMFSVVLLAVVAVLGLAAWGYFWWQTRALRKAMREQAAGAAASRDGTGDGMMGGRVIEGEAVVVEEVRTQTRRPQPGALPDE
jgi:hypothetical protein